MQDSPNRLFVLEKAFVVEELEFFRAIIIKSKKLYNHVIKVFDE